MPRWLAYVIIVAAFAAAVAAAFARVNYEWNWAAFWDYRQKFLQGWLVTVALSLAALATSIVIGGLTAMMLRSGRPLLEAAARVYVELIRGTPLLVQLLIGFYVVATAVGLENRYVAGVLLLSLFSGAYMAEIFRGGLDAIPKAQIDSGRAIGLTRWQSLRLVVLPQALRVIIPPLTSQYLNLTKNSSLAVAIGYPDLVSTGGTILGQTGQAIEVVLIWMVVYLTLSLLTSGFMNWFNARNRLVGR
jgi:polar amino acid transport system permease protein